MLAKREKALPYSLESNVPVGLGPVYSGHRCSIIVIRLELHKFKAARLERIPENAKKLIRLVTEMHGNHLEQEAQLEEF